MGAVRARKDARGSWQSLGPASPSPVGVPSCYGLQPPWPPSEDLSLHRIQARDEDGRIPSPRVGSEIPGRR